MKFVVKGGKSTRAQSLEGKGKEKDKGDKWDKGDKGKVGDHDDILLFGENFWEFTGKDIKRTKSNF